MKTFSLRAADVQRRWLLVDADGKTLGRLATEIARVLRGKHKPVYTPSMDAGDHVVVVNAKKVSLTGRKPEDKRYFHHTLYPGGATWTRLLERMQKHPERVIVQAVHGMLPKTKLGRSMIRKLKVYGGPDHPHAAQQPEIWDPGSTSARDR